MADTTRIRGSVETWSSLPLAAVAAIGAGLFGLGLAVGGYGAYVTLLIAEGVSPDAAGFGMSLFLLGQLIVVIPADRLSRSVSVDLVAALGLLFGGVAIATSGTTSLEVTYASRLGLGLGQGAAFVAGMKYVGLRTTGKDTATAQGLVGALFTLGLAIGLALTPLGIDHLGPTGPALIAAGVTIAGGLLTGRLSRAVDAEEAILRDYLSPFSSASGLALGLGNMAAFGFLMVAATWYTEVLAGTLLPVTIVLVGFALATFLGRAIGGWLSRRFGERATVGGSLLGLALVLGGLAVAIRFDAVVGIALGLVLTGFGFGIPFGPLFSLAFSELTNDAGVTLSGMLIVGNGGALVYPWLVGLLLAATAGHAAGFATMALSVGVIWVLWRWAIGS